jgi:hypothetical protein
MEYFVLLENKKLAIINLTCDYPFEYSIAELSRWAGLSQRVVSKMCKKLELDVIAGETGMHTKKDIKGMSKYLLNVF